MNHSYKSLFTCIGLPSLLLRGEDGCHIFEIFEPNINECLQWGLSWLKLIEHSPLLLLQACGHDTPWNSTPYVTFLYLCANCCRILLNWIGIVWESYKQVKHIFKQIDSLFYDRTLRKYPITLVLIWDLMECKKSFQIAFRKTFPTLNRTMIYHWYNFPRHLSTYFIRFPLRVCWCMKSRCLYARNPRNDEFVSFFCLFLTL